MSGPNAMISGARHTSVHCINLLASRMLKLRNTQNTRNGLILLPEHDPICCHFRAFRVFRSSSSPGQRRGQLRCGPVREARRGTASAGPTRWNFLFVLLFGFVSEQWSLDDLGNRWAGSMPILVFGSDPIRLPPTYNLQTLTRQKQAVNRR